jgi:site-specific recombinase XerD
MDEAVREFSLYLAAQGKSQRTITIYHDAALWFQRKMEVTDWSTVTKIQVREFIFFLLEEKSAGYANNIFRALQQFFRFLEEEEEISNPMRGMKPPKVAEKLVPVISDAEYARLIQSCSGKRFVDIRDRAIIEFFRSSGARKAEVTGLNVTDIDPDLLSAIVKGKGSRMRIVRFDTATGLALSKYLRIRKNHRYASSEKLWIGVDGPLYANAIYLMLKRRGVRAGVRINPTALKFPELWLLVSGFRLG